MRKVWILEDDAFYRHLYKSLFENVYEFRFFDNLNIFNDSLKNESPDLIIINVMPAEIGKQDCPFLIVSDIDDIMVLRKAYAAGATDYIIKPFNSTGMLVKIEQVFCSQKKSIGLAKIKNRNQPKLRLDPHRQSVRIAKEEVNLTPKEFRILSLLDQFKHGLSRDKITERIWNTTTVTFDTFDVHLFHLRSKISKLTIAIELSKSGKYRIRRKRSR